MHGFARPFATLLVLLVPSGLAAQSPPLPLDTLRVEVGARAFEGVARATRSVQVLDRAFIAGTPAGSVGDLLAWALGVDMLPRSTAQADVEIRGASFEGVLVMVDGVRASDTQTGHFDLDIAVPLAEIERIEILRGPASAQYGSDAVGGVIHIVTRRSAGVGMRVEGGSFGTAAGSISAGTGPLRVGAEHHRTDGDRPGTDSRITSVHAGAAARLGVGTLRGAAAFAARDFGAADFYAPFPSYEETRTMTLSALWSGEVAPSWVLEPRAHARRHSDDFILRREDPSFYRNRHTSWQVGAEVTARTALGERTRLAVGVEGVRDDIDSNALGVRHETRGAAFTEVVRGDERTALVQVGARADLHSEYGAFFAPSIAGSVRPSGSLRLRGSIGRSFRAPGWTDRFYEDPANIGTPDLDPERAWSGELGMTLSLPSAAALDVALFGRLAESLIDWAQPDVADFQGPWRTMNVDRARFGGVEAELRGVWRTARWSVGGTWLTFDARETDGFRSKYALRPLERSIVAGVDAPLGGGFAAAVRSRYARRTGEDAFTLIDARLSWTHGPLRFHIDGTNLANSSYLDVSVQPAPGRALRMGLAFTPTRRGVGNSSTKNRP